MRVFSLGMDVKCNDTPRAAEVVSEPYPKLQPTREWVYFVHGRTEGLPIKIGSSSSASVRIRMLQYSVPFEIVPLMVVNCAKYTERFFHQLFAQYVIRGEWFKPGERLLRFLEEEQREMLQTADLPGILEQYGAEPFDIRKAMYSQARGIDRKSRLMQHHG